MTLPARQPDQTPEAFESALVQGDLSKLTPAQRVVYYNRTCESLGLNPLTKPFEYITLNGKLQLYALRACTDQLRTIKGVSLEIVSRDVSDGILTVHVRATLPDGRKDEDLGTVPFSDSLKGDIRANAELKCVTKAKRRVTLSICGLGWLDETEVETIPGARKPKEPAPNVMIAHDRETGEIIESAAQPSENPAAEPAPASPPTLPAHPEAGAALYTADVPYTGAALSLEDMAREAAQRGETVFREFYKNLAPEKKKAVNMLGDELRGLLRDARCIRFAG